MTATDSSRGQAEDERAQSEDDAAEHGPNPQPVDQPPARQAERGPEQSGPKVNLAEGNVSRD